MKKILAVALLTVVATPASFLFTQSAKADTYSVCYPVTQSRLSQDASDHPGAYRDGYREGRESRRSRGAYEPRRAGGEFARGFEDGYFGRPFIPNAFKFGRYSLLLPPKHRGAGGVPNVSLLNPIGNSGQDYRIPDRVEYYTTQQCNNYYYPDRRVILPRRIFR